MSAIEHRRGSVEPLLRQDEGRDGTAGTSADGTETPPVQDRSPLQQLASSAALPALVGGFVGAVMAVIAVFALTALRPPLDPRLPGLASQVSGFQNSMFTLETAVRGAEVDVVRALDAGTALSGRIDEQAEGIRTAMAELAAARQQLRLETGPGSVVFGVSVVQLSDAVAAGRPFENEWVNLYALTAGNETLRDQLRRLMPLASTGVPTITDLRRSLRTTAAPRAPVIEAANLLQYGLNMVRSSLGVPLGTTPDRQISSGVVTDADRRLAEGDIAGAIATLGNLTEGVASAFSGWIATAQRRQAAETVVAEFTRVSTTALRARAKDSPG